LRTPAARRRASVSKNLANSSPCLKTIGVSSLSDEQREQRERAARDPVGREHPG